MTLRFAVVAMLSFIITDTACAQKLQTGIWRGNLVDSAGLILPFNFEVNDTAGAQQMVIINGDERYKVTDVKLKGDSVNIHMPLFDSEFKLKLDVAGLKGKWIKHLGNNDAAMDFTAVANTDWRFFKDSEKPVFDVSGRWSALFDQGAGKDTLIGEFIQTGSKLTGTFLSTSGDYRYLEGSVTGNKLYLSCFDGGHAFLFIAKIADKRTLTDGKFYSGYKGSNNWTAVKNENAKLPDAYSLTFLKPGYKKIAFTFKDVSGKEVSLSDNRFKNKVVIVQIMGSWCPNCMDETHYFVSSYYPKYHDKGVEIVGLSYERTTDFAKSKKTVQQLITHFQVPYPILITGYTPLRGDPQKSLPMLADFKGFPTTIIIDKKGDVRKIHTGFSGPGTGEYYTQFINEFQKLTDEMLAE